MTPPGRAGSRRDPRNGLRLLAAVGSVYAAAFLGRAAFREWISVVRLDTGKSSYYHYEFVELRLRARDPELLSRWRRSPPHAGVLRAGRPVTTIAGVTEVPLDWDAGRGAFIGRWPCPWNAPADEYVPVLEGEPALAGRLKAASFRIERRVPKPLPRRFVVLTMETVSPLAAMRIKNPDGRVRDWRGIVDWAKFVGADAFWILGGQTPGEKAGETWVSYNLPLLPEVARECHRRGLQFGVWAMCYLTMSKARLPRYEYALDVKDGRPVYTRAISLDDPRRPQDVSDFLKTFREVPEIDYLGLDYIRNALGGYELVDDFVAEMPGLRLPPEWPRLSRDERMVWFARKKILRKDLAFIDAWQWWRAHRVALIVAGIKRRLGDSKTLWAFTLTWDKGWHHGQDPVMMNDAGVDADALMLYEATGPQFEAMMKEWHAYVRRRDVQLVVGDVVDWPLHQRSPRGPGEFYYRLLRAGRDIYQDGPAAGFFIHDLGRALWGRLGPYSTLDWMRTARAAARRFKESADGGEAVAAARGGPSGPAGRGRGPAEVLWRSDGASR